MEILHLENVSFRYPGGPVIIPDWEDTPETAFP